MQPIVERIMDKFLVSDGCWEWIGGKDSDGYGQLAMPGNTTGRAHRLVYELLIGPIGVGLELDHLCLNRSCVRPSHLEPVTRAVNISRVTQDRHGQSKKTHCPRGHLYDEKNTRHHDGRRHCRACAVIHTANYERHQVLSREVDQ